MISIHLEERERLCSLYFLNISLILIRSLVEA